MKNRAGGDSGAPLTAKKKKIEGNPWKSKMRRKGVDGFCEMKIMKRNMEVNKGIREKKGEHHCTKTCWG